MKLNKRSLSKIGKNNPFRGKHHTEETKRKISLANKGKHHTEEAKRKISANSQQGCGVNNSFYGHEHSLESKTKMGCRGKNHPMYGKRHSVKTKNLIKINHPDFSGNKNPFYGKNHTEEARLKMSVRQIGKDNVAWRGGKSFIKYTLRWTNLLRKKIRIRDNYICQHCGKKWHKGLRKFAVHHIDYNKKNCKENNLITLCNECHIITNFNRRYWKNILKIKYLRRPT